MIPLLPNLPWYINLPLLAYYFWLGWTMLEIHTTRLTFVV